MKKPSRTFSFQIPEALLQKLNYIAAQQCRSTGSILRVLARDCVDRFEREHGEIG